MNVLKKYLNNNKKVEGEILQKEGVKLFRTGIYKTNETEYQLFRPANILSLKTNQQINILIYTKDGVFIFRTVITSLTEKIIKIKPPKTYKKVQRRGLLRANLRQEFELEFIKDNKKIKEKHFTNNISGSGFSFYADEILPIEKNYKTIFYFENRKILSNATIIEIRKNLKENLPKYRYSAKFTSLNEYDKNYIIKKCVIEHIRTINI